MLSTALIGARPLQIGTETKEGRHRKATIRPGRSFENSMLGKDAKLRVAAHEFRWRETPLNLRT